VIVERYRDSDAADWDAFVRASRNGTFLFERGYMDYHRDRFPDHSLLVREPNGELIAVLPAHAAGDLVASHNGLSYGGIVIGSRMTTPNFLRAFEAVLSALRADGFAILDYKTIPHIYHRQPAEEDRWALFRLGAQLSRRDLLSVVNRDYPLPYQHRRARGIKKARVAGVTVQQEADFAEFWELLAATLADRFDAAPVHSRDEIQMLRDRFPLNIRLHTSRQGSKLLAGVVTYEADRAAHAQYIAASPAGRDACALDLIFDELLDDPRRERNYFDLGGSHEEYGRAIKVGLIEQKEGFGARSVAHEQYRIDLMTVRPGILTEALR
jgi:Acetyltransferase (GNAT) domain